MIGSKEECSGMASMRGGRAFLARCIPSRPRFSQAKSYHLPRFLDQIGQQRAVHTWLRAMPPSTLPPSPLPLSLRHRSMRSEYQADGYKQSDERSQSPHHAFARRAARSPIICPSVRPTITSSLQPHMGAVAASARRAQASRHPSRFLHCTASSARAGE